MFALIRSYTSFLCCNLKLYPVMLILWDWNLDLCCMTFDSKFFTCLHAGQMKNAILNGVELEDNKRELLNKIEQVSF